MRRTTSQGFQVWGIVRFWGKRRKVDLTSRILGHLTTTTLRTNIYVNDEVDIIF